MNARIRAGWRMFRRAMRTARTLATSRTLPIWLRVLFAIGCVQIPVLPVDEIALVAALAIMAVFYRSQLVAAWQGSAS